MEPLCLREVDAVAFFVFCARSGRRASPSIRRPHTPLWKHFAGQARLATFNSCLMKTNWPRTRMFGKIAVFVSVAVMPSSAHADTQYNAVGLIFGGFTALVIPPIAGAFAWSSGRVAFWPTTGVSFGSALLLGAAGVGIGTLDSSGAGEWAPSLGALIGAVGGAIVYGALSDPGVAPLPRAPGVVNWGQQSVPTVSVSVTPGGGSGTLLWQF